MEERRRSNRLKLEAKLIVHKVADSEEEHVRIHIMDISRTGVGFSCPQKLEINTVYEAFLRIWTQEVLHVFLEVIRDQETEEGYGYGAIFVGMTEMDAARIAVYETVENEKLKQ